MKKLPWLAPALALPFALGLHVGSARADAWQSTKHAVKSGGEAVEDTGEAAGHETKKGGEAVGHETKKVAGKTEDETIKADIKARLAATKGVDADKVHVSVKKGTATLSGRVHSKQEAMKAIQIAENTAGVDRVRSKMTW